MDEIKAKIAATYDPIEILDILSMDTVELVDALEEQILENIYLFKDLDIGDYNDT